MIASCNGFYVLGNSDRYTYCNKLMGFTSLNVLDNILANVYKQLFLSVEPFCVNLPGSFKNVAQFVPVIKMFLLFFVKMDTKLSTFMPISDSMNTYKSLQKMHWQNFANRK